jgi:hypothetical protein
VQFLTDTDIAERKEMSGDGYQGDTYIQQVGETVRMVG